MGFFPYLRMSAAKSLIVRDFRCLIINCE